MTPVVDSPSEAPAWFRAALSVRPVHGDTVVRGVPVHHRSWGPAQGPSVVLVHGGAAHSGWWDHVAPLLARTSRVVAVDMTGHGDSGRRDAYDMATWAQEVVEVADALGMVQPVVVGHSMGGWVAATAGAAYGDRLGGVVVIDSPLFDQAPEEAVLAKRRRPTRVYASVEEAADRFQTLPPQDVVLPWVRENVLAQSLREVDGGWTWKFDPMLFGQRPALREILPQVSVRLALLRCEHGLISESMVRDWRALIGPGLPVVELPDAGHHPMLDQPLPLVAAVRTVLECWDAADRSTAAD